MQAVSLSIMTVKPIDVRKKVFQAAANGRLRSTRLVIITIWPETCLCMVVGVNVDSQH